jgi:hypothetical protein
VDFFSVFCFTLGLISVVGGGYWMWRLSHPQENEGKTEDDERLINVGLGEYQTENLVAFRGIVAILLGVILIIIGLVV